MIDFEVFTHQARGFSGMGWRKLLQLAPTPSSEIFREGAVRLMKYETPDVPPVGEPILVIPSLINRHYILDLLSGKSLIESWVLQGRTVYLIQWDAPEDEDRWVTPEQVISGRIRRCVSIVRELEDGKEIHLFGHCLGGTLATLYAARYPEGVLSLTLLTSPIDFEQGGLLGTWSRYPGLDVDALVDAYGNVPWPLLHASFHLLRPGSDASMYWSAAKRIGNREAMRNFFALQAWSFDNVSFPGECFKALIRRFYRENAILQGDFVVGGKRARLQEIRVPILSIAARGDHIVPAESTLGPEHLSGGVSLTRWVVDGGHVGCLIGRKGIQELWPRMSRWYAERESAREARFRS